MKKYRGIFIPIVTPFVQGAIDWPGLDRLIDFYCATGIAGLIPCGTTGETSTLTHAEHEQVIRHTVEKVRNRVLVIAGTGSNNTAEALRLTQAAQAAHADAVLVVSPYYNKPTDDGIYQYYQAIAGGADIDILIYNMPGRTASNINVELVKRIAGLPRIKGIKEGAADIQQLIDLVHFFADQDFSVLTGEDSLLFECCAAGGDGGIMAAAGVMPRELVRLHGYLANGRLEEAQKLNRRLRPLLRALFCETNPIPIKFALSELFGIRNELRSPLTPLRESNAKLVSSLMHELGLSSG